MANINHESNDEEEEEEVIVYANFEEASVNKEIFYNPDVKFKLIGLDSDTPILQFGDQTFKGNWQDTIGTKVFFEEDPSPEQVDPVFTVLPQKMLKYKCMSTKTLAFSRIFLKPKNQPEDPVNNTEESVLNESEGSASENENENEQVPESEVIQLATSTVNPDSSTNEVMSDIVAETIMDTS